MYISTYSDFSLKNPIIWKDTCKITSRWLLSELTRALTVLVLCISIKTSLYNITSANISAKDVPRKTFLETYFFNYFHSSVRVIIRFHSARWYISNFSGERLTFLSNVLYVIASFGASCLLQSRLRHWDIGISVQILLRRRNLSACVMTLLSTISFNPSQIVNFLFRKELCSSSLNFEVIIWVTWFIKAHHIFILL